MREQMREPWDPSERIGRRPLPAWAMSMLMHFALVILLAYLTRFAPRGAATDDTDRTVGVALVRHVAGEREILTTEQAQAVAESSSAAVASESLPSTEELEVDLSDILPTANDGAGSPDMLSVPPAGRTGAVAGGLPGLSDQARTTVFGAPGSGHRFVYVFDRSGSMAGFGGRPLAAAKRELIASLHDLNDTSQFQIIFYNEDPHVFRPQGQQPRLVWANEQGRSDAEEFIQGIQANGSTRHLRPLKMALAMRPDVVFFLTDADEPELSRRELRQIQTWNSATAINTIEFGFGPSRRSDNFLVRLASQNGGQHVYVDVSAMRRQGVESP